jgi:DNA-binding CsgD family transcriptional regulator
MPMLESTSTTQLRAAMDGFGRVAAGIGGPVFFDRLVTALGEVVRFSNSDLVIVDTDPRDEAPPTLVGVYCNEGPYSAVIRERYLPYGYQLCPEIAAVRRGWTNGIYSMAELGADSFLEPACYEAYYGLLELRDFYDLFAELGDGRVAGWSIGRHLDDPAFTPADDHLLRSLAPLLIGLVTRHCQLAFPPCPRLPLDTPVALPTEITATLLKVATEPLTERELEVALLLVRGLSTKAVSRLLSITPMTEAVHRKSIYRKLRMASQVELVSYCLHALTGTDR